LTLKLKLTSGNFVFATLQIKQFKIFGFDGPGMYNVLSPEVIRICRVSHIGLEDS